MTLGDLQTRTQERIGGGTFYGAAPIISALNQAQRLFCLLTLCLETTAPFTLSAATRFYRALSVFPDWLMPLRVRIASPGGTKVIPSRLQDFDAADMRWQSAIGLPAHYDCLGCDFLAFDRVPATAGTLLEITYAQAPVPLVNTGDLPTIPEQFHPALMDFAIPRLRAQEGGREFSKVLPLVQNFLDETAKLAQYVRARNLAHRYDRMPFELQSFDRSTLAGIVGGKAWPPVT